MQRYIVKIVSDLGNSTGFIYFPVQSDKVYVICSLHGIANEEDLSTSANLEIKFFDASKTTYKVLPTDLIIKGHSYKTEDLAVIVFERTKLPVEINDPHNSKAPRLLALTGEEKTCEIKGLPKSLDNSFIRTLSNVQILTDSDFATQIQLQVDGPLTNHPDADDLLQGYSGSPLIIQNQGHFYCFGIFSEFDDTSKQVIGVTFTGLNQLLSEASQGLVDFQKIETNEQLLTDIRRIQSNTARVLGRVHDKIGNVHLERKTVVSSIKDSVESKALTLITGIAGVGKSAMTKISLESMQDEYEIIALQGEQLDKQSIDAIFVEQSIGIENTFERLLQSPGLKRKQILLLDSIEKIVETSHADTITDFFRLLAQRPDLKIVLTCRSYASENFQVRYLRDFPPVSIFDVPPLGDEEFAEILKQYPDLAIVATNPSVDKILRIPFNLDKATLLERQRIESIDTELAFKNLVWKYVVENCDKEPSVEMQALRGSVLEQLAVERAKRMTSYVNLGPEKAPVLQKLLSDNIVGRSIDTAKGYAISHDIFEDWALVRFIDKTFASNSPFSSIESFLATLGYSPTMRRSYRMWINEKFTDENSRIDDFITLLFRDQNLENYWKDETLLAILQTKHFQSFINRFRALLFHNNNILLKRCILLLNVACQKPDFEFLEKLNRDERRTAYSNAYLIPYGSSWGTLLEFIASEIGTLTNEFQTILPILEQWGKGLRFETTIPSESKHVGKIILAFFAQHKKDMVSDHYGREDHFPEMVTILFKLSSIYTTEVANLLQEAIEFQRNRENYKLDHFHSEILEQSLSWINSIELSKHVPQLIINAARNEWFYFPPTPEQLAGLDQHARLFASPMSEHDENTFGITSGMKNDYSPSGALQTPTLNLLRNNAKLTIQFIVELFNHSVKAYRESDFLMKDSEIFRADPRAEISYTLATGQNVMQFGSSVLWSMYRGGRIATPDLLRSVLQALEKHLLDLAAYVYFDKEQKNQNIKSRLDYLIEYLITNSESVATTAVVISVATAYPHVIATHVLPLLRVKEFHQWDLERCVHESFILNPGGFKAMNQIIQEENAHSNKLPHRKEHIQTLMLNLGFSKERDKIVAILEELKRQEGDESWRFMLSNMDFRKLEIVKEMEKGFMVQAKLDPDLHEIAEQNQINQSELQIISGASNWALQKTRNANVCADDEFQLWQSYFETAFNRGIAHPGAKLFNHPALLAFIGLRDFFSRLSENEKTKSIDRIFSIIKRDIERSKKPFDFDLDSEFSPIETDIAYSALIEIILKTSNSVQVEAKYLCFWSMVLQNNNLEKRKLFEGARTRLPQFATLCVACMYEYAKAFPIRRSLENYLQFHNHLPPQGINGFLHAVSILLKEGIKRYKQLRGTSKLERQYRDIMDRISLGLERNKLEVSIDGDFDDRISSHYLIQALTLVPANTKKESLRQYIRAVLRYIIKNIDVEPHWGQQTIQYELLHDFEKVFALFLLEQPIDISMSFLKELVDDCFESKTPRREHIKFIENSLKQIILTCTQNQGPTFWLFWDHLYSKISLGKRRYFLNIILLDYEYWSSSKKDWLPIRGKSSFFENVIMNQIEIVKETSKLLGGIGFTELLPQGINWLWKQISEHGIQDKEELRYTEKLITEIFYNQSLRNAVQKDKILRDNYVRILDRLIDQSSPSAYLIREDVISFKG